MMMDFLKEVGTTEVARDSLKIEYLLILILDIFLLKKKVTTTKNTNKRLFLSCLFCDRTSSSDLFLISFLITSLEMMYEVVPERLVKGRF